MLQIYHQKQVKRHDPVGHHEGMLFKIEKLLNGQNETMMLQLEIAWREISSKYANEADSVNAFLQLTIQKLDEPPILDSSHQYSGLI